MFYCLSLAPAALHSSVGSLTVWRNGVSVLSATSDWFAYNNAGTGRAVFGSAANGNLWSGNIDEVRLWTSAMSTAQASAGYRLDDFAGIANLQLYYAFGEEASTTVLDRSGNAAPRDWTNAFSSIRQTRANSTPLCRNSTGGGCGCSVCPSGQASAGGYLSVDSSVGVEVSMPLPSLVSTDFSVCFWAQSTKPAAAGGGYQALISLGNQAATTCTLLQLFYLDAVDPVNSRLKFDFLNAQSFEAAPDKVKPNDDRQRWVSKQQTAHTTHTHAHTHTHACMLRTQSSQLSRAESALLPLLASLSCVLLCCGCAC